MLYVIGLGNPGHEYKKTRHNIGAIILEKLVGAFDLSPLEYKKKYTADITTGEIRDVPVIFSFPQTYMNLSGVSVKELCRYIKPDDILVVIYDDLDIPTGKMKLSYERGAGGHNGVSSIIEHMGSKSFVRIRVGIGQHDVSGKSIRSGGIDQAVYVLQSFTPDEKENINALIPKIQEVLSSLATNGRERTISIFG